VNDDGKKRNPLSEAVFLSSIVTSRAFENVSCIVFSNAGGSEEDGYAGLSQITMPFMGPIAKAEGSREQMIIGEVDMKILAEAEDTYKVREDLANPDFHYPVYSS
jgi:predicted amidohydrolase